MNLYPNMDPKWTALTGVHNGRRVLLDLSDIILIEETEVAGKDACMLINRWGVRVQVMHTAFEIGEMITKNAKTKLVQWKKQRKEYDMLKAKVQKQKSEKDET